MAKTYTIALKSNTIVPSFTFVKPFQTYTKKNAALAALKAYRQANPTIRNAVLFSQWNDMTNPNIPAAPVEREFTVTTVVRATSLAEAQRKVTVR
jgi:Tfp pilus assembly major pilin PilA